MSGRHRPRLLIRPFPFRLGVHTYERGSIIKWRGMYRAIGRRTS